MNTKDMAAACVFLTESIGKSKAAKSLGISSQTLKKYLGFAAVPEKLKQFVPKELSRDDCTKLYQIISNVPKAVKIAERIIPLDQKLRKEYLKLLARSPVIASQVVKKDKKRITPTKSYNRVNQRKCQEIT